MHVYSIGRWIRNDKAKEQNVESRQRISFGKFLDYSCNFSVSMKLLQNKNRPLFKKKKVQHALYLPRILSPSPEISIPFHHFPSFVQVKGHLPLLRQAHGPLHATAPFTAPLI